MFRTICLLRIMPLPRIIRLLRCRICPAAAVLPLLAAAGAWATETENLGLRILPAPGMVAVDGKVDDWDLSGGVFTTGDAEKLREKLAPWFHAMYDAENLYLLTRWIDQTPLSNPGTIKGDYGFAGDCLQARIIC